VINNSKEKNMHLTDERAAFAYKIVIANFVSLLIMTASAGTLGIPHGIIKGSRNTVSVC
jgi:hypothetical protein